jgi:hypothetical protein
VQYECARNGLSYNLQTIIDHTPPTLALENVVNGLARGPVDISDLEEGCKIGITLNGGKMSYREELTLSGDYKIILQDEAGNLTDYEFSILVYFDLSSWIFFAMVMLAVVGTGVYLYLERKRMRVRYQKKPTQTRKVGEGMYLGIMPPTAESSPGIFGYTDQTGTGRAPDAFQTDNMRKEGVVEWMY